MGESGHYKKFPGKFGELFGIGLNIYNHEDYKEKITNINSGSIWS
jgi:hypothetical protein